MTEEKPEQPPVTPGKRCGKCGSMYPPDATWCGNCNQAIK